MLICSVFILLIVAVLATLFFTKLKAWWKYLNLGFFLVYMSMIAYWIYIGAGMGGWLIMLNSIIWMFAHFSILWLSIIFFYKNVQVEKAWK